MTGSTAKLKKALSEYYRVADMEAYDPVFRAIGHFIHKWGRIDRFESLNEHWLELEAGIRTDFNIFGTKLDFVKNLKRKSRMRAFFRKSGVETIPQRKSLGPRRRAHLHPPRRLSGRGQARLRRRRPRHLQDFECEASWTPSSATGRTRATSSWRNSSTAWS